MQIQRSTFLAINLGILLLLVIIAAIIGWLVLRSNVHVADAERIATINRLKGSAELYHSRLQFYDGVCADIGLPDGFTCNETNNAYAIDTRLESGHYWCGDSAGFNGETSNSLGQNTVCQ